MHGCAALQHHTRPLLAHFCGACAALGQGVLVAMAQDSDQAPHFLEAAFAKALAGACAALGAAALGVVQPAAAAAAWDVSAAEPERQGATPMVCLPAARLAHAPWAPLSQPPDLPASLPIPSPPPPPARAAGLSLPVGSHEQAAAAGALQALMYGARQARMPVQLACIQARVRLGGSAGGKLAAAALPSCACAAMHVLPAASTPSSSSLRMHACAHVARHSQTHARAHTCACTRVHTRTCTCTRTRTRARAQALVAAIQQLGGCSAGPREAEAALIAALCEAVCCVDGGPRVREDAE